MKLRVFPSLLICGLIFAGILNAAEKPIGIPGKWATDAVSTVVRWNNKPDIRGGNLDCPKSAICGDNLVRPGPFLVSPDGVALTMELKSDTAKLTGKVSEVVTRTTMSIEEGRVDGNKFKFTVVTKKGINIRIETTYEGELIDPATIKVVRIDPKGKPVDLNPDGTPEPLIFHRAK